MDIYLNVDNNATVIITIILKNVKLTIYQHDTIYLVKLQQTILLGKEDLLFLSMVKVCAQ